MSFFQFQNPEYLLLLLLLPVFGWLAGRAGPEAAIRFSSISLAKAVSRARHSRPGRFLFGLRLLALASLVVALARPQIGQMNNTDDTEGIDIVITLDLSISMAALDLSKNINTLMTRLDAAKQVVREFIDKRPYDRIALVAFAADAYVVSPLTLNHDWLKKNLDRLELGEIDGFGTAIGTALGASVNRLRDHEARSKIVILLTDGENNSGKITPVDAAEAAKSLGVKVYTIATGRQGTVPVAETTRDGRLLRDNNGDPIYRRRTMPSNYDETELRKIAKITDGLFFQATEGGDLEHIYDEIDTLEKTRIELRSYATFTEYFIWPTLIGLGLLTLEQLLSNTRYRRLP